MDAPTGISAATAQFDGLLATLCAYLADELERQENVLALCKAQGVAARSHDTEYLEANSAALAEMIDDAVKAEKLRLGVVETLVAMLALPAERQTLTTLISLAPEPWGTRMRFYQERLQEVLGEIRTVVRQNAPILRRSLRIVNETMRTLEQCADAAGNYSAAGTENGVGIHGPAILDRRG